MENKNSSSAIPALVVSIVGFVLSLLFALGGVIVSIVGLVMANKAHRQNLSNSNAARVIAIIGIVAGVLNMLITAGIMMSYIL